MAIKMKTRTDRKQFNKIVSYLIVFFIALVFAYYFIFWHPTEHYDLYRYFIWLDNLRYGSVYDTIKFIMSRGEFLTMIYALLVAKSGLYGLFQFFPTFMSILIICSIPIHYVSKMNYKMRYAWMAIVAFLSTYEMFLIPAGVRSTLAFAIFSLGLYVEYVIGREKESLILYALTPFVHLGSLMLIATRLAMGIRGFGVKIATIIVILFFVVYPGGEFINFVLGDAYKTGNFIFLNLHKLGNYLTPLFPLSVAYLYKISKLVLFAFIFYFSSKLRLKEYSRFYLYLSLLAIMALSNYLLWYRILEMIIIGMPIAVIEFINKYYVEKKIVTTMIILIIFSLVGLRVQVAYFYLPDYTILDVMPSYKQGWKYK